MLGSFFPIFATRQRASSPPGRPDRIHDRRKNDMQSNTPCQIAQVSAQQFEPTLSGLCLTIGQMDNAFRGQEKRPGDTSKHKKMHICIPALYQKTFTSVELFDITTSSLCGSLSASLVHLWPRIRGGSALRSSYPDTTYLNLWKMYSVIKIAVTACAVVTALCIAVRLYAQLRIFKEFHLEDCECPSACPSAES